MARAAIESLFENFADGVVAPAFWYAILGLPGLFVAKTVNTLDWDAVNALRPEWNTRWNKTVER